ncbi:hypothetical protein CPB83DRAFT_289519 [Crepidotus variabilis]|uniref:Uncharacterized protein n=1 Tax=Crepidotus variabilis TaxID=179855 RepID=A0A9P6JQV1_9AGAR|nr:hypothetical protein CPB83DRAFT_289519 [Crepidotus variabilis]
MILEILATSAGRARDREPLPNPLTPKAYTIPEVGAFLSFDEYTMVGSLAVLIWDVLNATRQDYTLLSTHRITFLNIVFVISRLSALLSETFSVLLFTTRLETCALSQWLANSFFFLYRLSTSTLFYARVQGVYQSQPYALAFFRFLWLMAAGGATMGFFSSHAFQLHPTKYCSFASKGGHWLVTIPISEAVFDVLICSAVTYKIGHDHSSPERPFWRRWLGRGEEGVTRFSDRFLKDHQLYVSLTACVKLPEIVIIFASISVPSLSGFRSALAFPDMTLTNILATKIYRGMKLGKKGLASFETTATDPLFV